jgi:hypothetical protein
MRSLPQLTTATEPKAASFSDASSWWKSSASGWLKPHLPHFVLSDWMNARLDLFAARFLRS